MKNCSAEIGKLRRALTHLEFALEPNEGEREFDRADVRDRLAHLNVAMVDLDNAVRGLV